MELSKKSYVKPTVEKHETATRIVGSCICGISVSTTSNGCGSDARGSGNHPDGCEVYYV
jgi:hypothetical protein